MPSAVSKAAHCSLHPLSSCLCLNSASLHLYSYTLVWHPFPHPSRTHSFPHLALTSTPFSMNPIPSHRDATRAFVSGNFSDDGLTNDLTGLSGEQCIGIADWRDFYFKTYIHVGKLVGRIYDEQGKPREALGEFDELLKEGKRLRDVGSERGRQGDGLTDDLTGLSGEQCIGIADWRDFDFETYIHVGYLVGRFYDEQGKGGMLWASVSVAKAAEKKYPGCNSQWAQNEGGKVGLPLYCACPLLSLPFPLIFPSLPAPSQPLPSCSLPAPPFLLPPSPSLPAPSQPLPSCSLPAPPFLLPPSPSLPAPSQPLPSCSLPAPPFLLPPSPSLPAPSQPLPSCSFFPNPRSPFISPARLVRHLKAQGRGEAIPRVQPVMGAERGRQGNVSPSLLFSKSSLRCASLPTSHSPLMVLRSCLVPHCSPLAHTSLFLPPRCSFLLPAPLSGSTSAASHKADAVETRYPRCIL
ncbi:unnamed protein product [Closterium sp. Naga37s-1]|nr:unnamed protein product [Closterium sp. Naga37s-1]